MEQLELELAGNWVTHAVEEQSTTTSQHTGRELLVGRVRFDVRGQAANDEVRRALGAAAAGTEHLHGRWRGHDREFRVGEWSYSQNGATTDFATYTVELKEAENVKADRLTIDDLELEPYAYEEHLTNDAITIQCRVVVDAETSDRIERLMRMSDKRDHEYFEVTRHGVEDAARTMRFGKCAWSRAGDTVKHRLFLVEKRFDERKPRPAIGGLFHPELDNGLRRVAVAEAFSAALLDELTSAGAISQEAAERVKTRANDNYWRAYRALFEESDVDLFE
jgi:hypothetical protein